MKTGAVSSVKTQPDISRVKLENVNRDIIPFNFLEKITETQGIDLFISKDSDIHRHPDFDIFRVKATKKVWDLPIEVESKHIFTTIPNASGIEILSKITSSLDAVINRLYKKYGSTLMAIQELSTDSTAIQCSKKMISKANSKIK